MSRFHRLSLLTTAAVFALSMAVAPAAMAEKPEGKGKSEHAEKGGKPDKGNHGGNDKNHSDNNHHSHGGRVSSSDVLVDGLTAVAVQNLLGVPTTSYRIGAKPLPPGIQKNLARGKPLPPGLSKERVPEPILMQLPRIDGTEWMRVGTELILIDATSQVIRQVVRDVFN